MTDMMADIMSGYRLTFGKYKGKLLSTVHDYDYQYLMWLAKQDWVTDEYPEVAVYIQAIDVPVSCPGTLDGQPCPRTVWPCGFCFAHMQADRDGRGLHLTTCIKCGNVAKYGEYCGNHDRASAKRERDTRYAEWCANGTPA